MEKGHSVCDKFLNFALDVEKSSVPSPVDLCRVEASRRIFTLTTAKIEGVNLEVMKTDTGYKSAELTFIGDLIRDQVMLALRGLMARDEAGLLSRMKFVEETGWPVRSRLKVVFKESPGVGDHVFTFSFRPGILRSYAPYEMAGESVLRAIGAIKI